MKDIIKQFSQALQSDDLFLFWEQELGLRNEIRKRPVADFTIDKPEEFDFLLRSLYYSGQRNDFLQILFANMNNITAVNWLLNSAPEILHDFLNFVPFHIINTRPAPRQLNFLITIFNNGLQEQFANIVNVLELEACQHLLPRTGNPDLRDLIRNRISLLEQTKLNFSYGLLKSDTRQQSFSTIHGDKLYILIKAAENIQASLPANFDDPYGQERFNLLLDVVETIFNTGLVEDSLAVLLDTYEDYLDKSRLVDLNQEEQNYDRLNKLVRKILPLYALLSDPTHPYLFTLNFYRHCFNLLSPYSASMYYLDIYQTILESLQGYNKNGLYEIMEKTRSIRLFRPDDKFFIQEDEIITGFNKSKMENLSKTVRERLSALPHEAFVIMEFLRLLIKQGYQPGEQIVYSLLISYMDLWKWVPNKLFFSQLLTNELVPLLNEKRRREFNRLSAGINNYSLDKLLDDFNIKPDLFRNKDSLVRLQILTGKFMGV